MKRVGLLLLLALGAWKDQAPPRTFCYLVTEQPGMTLLEAAELAKHPNPIKDGGMLFHPDQYEALSKGAKRHLTLSHEIVTTEKCPKI